MGEKEGEQMKAPIYLITNSFTFTLSKLSRGALYLSLLSLLAGCGASISPRGSSSNSMYPSMTDFASREPTKSLGAECSQFDAKDFRLSGKVATYYVGTSLQEDRVRLRFTGLADQFSNNGGVKIQMFRWRADLDGTKEIDNNPVAFDIERAQPDFMGNLSLARDLTSLTIHDVVRLRQNAGISGTTSQEFFDRTSIIVKSVDYSWDALKIVMYENNVVIGQVDLLMPIFPADPNVYAGSHSMTLNQLHPFWSTRTLSGMTEETWQTRSKNFCF